MNLLITIDTEPDCDTRWNRSNPLTFTSVTYGIPKLLRPIWDKYSINPIYFVSPEVVQNKQCCKILKEEVKKGAIIGAHLHSEYIAPNITIKNPAGKPSKEYPCFAHSTKVEFEKIKNLTNLIKKNIGVKPIWYRAARYGADLDTIKSLKQLGYKHDSSITPGINWSKQGGPDHSKAPLQPYYISKEDYYKPSSKNGLGIIEHPITIQGKRFGLNFFDKWWLHRWLRPSHMTLFEQKTLVNQIKKDYKTPELVLMFHSMEVMPGKSPYVRNKLQQKLFLKRLEKTIKYINLENYNRYKNKIPSNIIMDLICKIPSDKKIIPIISKLKSKKILDVGIGSGDYVKYFHKSNKIEGVDPNPNLCKLNLKIYQCNAKNFSQFINEDYDLIFSTWMTEYLSEDDLKLFFENGYKKLRKKGKLITTIIEDSGIGSSYTSLAKRIKGMDKFSYTKNQVTNLILNSGFRTCNLISLNSHFGIPWAFLVVAEK